MKRDMIHKAIIKEQTITMLPQMEVSRQITKGENSPYENT